MSKTDETTGKKVFTKTSGAKSPVLRRKKSESEEDFISRMKTAGWTGLEEGQYHWADNRMAITASKPDSQTPQKDQGKDTEENTPSTSEVEASTQVTENKGQTDDEEKKKEET